MFTSRVSSACVVGVAWLATSAGLAHAAITVTQQTLTLDLAAPITPAGPGTYTNSLAPQTVDLGPCVVQSQRTAEITSDWNASSITFRTNAAARRSVVSGDASGTSFGDGSPITAIALAVVRFTVSETTLVTADFQQIAFTNAPGAAGPAYRLTNVSSGVDLVNTNNPADAALPAQLFTLQPGNVYEFQLCSLTNLTAGIPGALAIGDLQATWTSQLTVVPAPAALALLGLGAAAGSARRRR